jgi:hypothetical protein
LGAGGIGSVLKGWGLNFGGGDGSSGVLPSLDEEGNPLPE